MVFKNNLKVVGETNPTHKNKIENTGQPLSKMEITQKKNINSFKITNDSKSSKLTQTHIPSLKNFSLRKQYDS